MPKIQLSSEIPLNIIELSVRDRRAIRAHYERGWLIILKDIKISADFSFLEAVSPPSNSGRRRDKYVLTLAEHSQFDGTREDHWRPFKDEIFAGNRQEFDRFQAEVRSVNSQFHWLADRIFKKYRFDRKRVTWKFQRNCNENLHIDNIDGSNSKAQLRIFANVATTPRVWGIGEHIRTYGRRYFASAELHRFVDDPFRFNNTLTMAAFGRSRDSVDEPRHVVEFAPGEIWMVNSAVTAHQVKSGNLLTIGSFEFPYDRYDRQSETLPSLIREIQRSEMASASLVSRPFQNLIRGMSFRGR